MAERTDITHAELDAFMAEMAGQEDRITELLARIDDLAEQIDTLTQVVLLDEVAAVLGVHPVDL